LVGERWKGLMMRAKYLEGGKKNEPVEITEILGKVIEHAAVGIDVRQADMIDGWDGFVPDDWRGSTPIGVREGVLLIEVPNGTAAAFLRYQKAALLGVIAQEYGDDVVTSVRVIIARY